MVTQDIERIAQREGGRHGELYLVTGATGNTGRTTVLRLAALGKRVRAMVRPTATADEFESLKRDNVEVVFGDYLNYSTLQRAVRGVDYVIATVGVGLERGQNTLENIEVRGNTWLFEVAKAAGVKHLTLVSVLRADEFPDVPLFAAKKRAEDALRRSGLTYTILRPSGIVSARALLNEARRVRHGKPLSVFGEGVNRASPILVTDLASLAAKASETPQTWNATFDIGGPQALSGVERIREIGHAVGVEPKIAHRPLWLIAVVRQTLGRLSRNVRGFTAFIDVLVRQDFSVDMRKTAPLFGLRLTSLREFITANIEKVEIEKQG